jgi:hypothetical protein
LQQMFRDCSLVILQATSPCSCRWGETMILNCGHRRAYYSSPRWYRLRVWRAMVEWY